MLFYSVPCSITLLSLYTKGSLVRKLGWRAATKAQSNCRDMQM